MCMVHLKHLVNLEHLVHLNHLVILTPLARADPMVASRAVGWWLAGCAGMCVGAVVLGGVTR